MLLPAIFEIDLIYKVCYNTYMIPAYLKKYFWEVDTARLDPKKTPEYVIARILEHGDIDAIRWMFATFDKKKISEVFATRRGFSSRTIYFWKSIFNLRENQILCLKKFYRETRKRLWPY